MDLEDTVKRLWVYEQQKGPYYPYVTIEHQYKVVRYRWYFIYVLKILNYVNLSVGRSEQDE